MGVETPQALHARALAGFNVLGPIANPAIPTLVTFLEDEPLFGRQAETAIHALMIYALSAKGASEREIALDSLKWIDPAAAAKLKTEPR
jgi:hypothetical protein